MGYLRCGWTCKRRISDDPVLQIFFKLYSYTTFDSDEACDVIVDGVGFSDQPGFRDGVISEAVDEVVAGNILYFSAAGDYGNGFKLTSVSFFPPFWPSKKT